MLETLDYTIRIGSTPTFLYFDMYMYMQAYFLLLDSESEIKEKRGGRDIR